MRLTGIDPDRWEEEKRRGLTIDLGFAWGTLPSGREVGFVDVPGHERFVRNMLAGVGPVRLVLFVVAADEGWKPQSEEHLAIVDVLGVDGGVVALTKSDLVDEARLERAMREVRERLEGSALEGAAVVACSSPTGDGLEELRAALDAIVSAAQPPPQRGRPRIAVDRSFTIRGAGTVVTGTLTGGSLSVGEEAVLHPSGASARIRSLQTHRRPVRVARPVSRVAANLAGLSKRDVERGDVLARPGQWRPTSLIEARIRPIRGLAHALTPRGAYKLYTGSAERDASIRLYGADEVRAGATAFARIRLSHPVVVEPGDRFVLREAGRRATVAGGAVLDADPPARPGPRPEERLRRRERARPEELARLVVSERRAVRADELPILAGPLDGPVEGARRAGAWWVADEAFEAISTAAVRLLEDHHRRQPLSPGIDAAEVRRAIERAVGPSVPAIEGGVAAAVLGTLEGEGALARDGSILRLSGHRVTLGGREEEASRLVAAVARGEPTPPGVRELEAAGFARELIEASSATGRLVRVTREIVVTPEFARRAEEVARSEAASPEGITVSRFRELLGTTRKYALPLLEHLDARGITRRDGDVRRLR